MKVNYLRALTSQPRVCFLWRPPTVLTSLIIYYCRESKAQLSISQRLSCAAFVLFCGPWVKNWIGTRPSTGTNPTETLFCNLKDGEVIKFLLQKLTLTPNPNRRFGWELWRLHTFLYLLEPRTWTCSQWTPRSTSHRRTEKKNSSWSEDIQECHCSKDLMWHPGQRVMWPALKIYTHTTCVQAFLELSKIEPTSVVCLPTCKPFFFY